MSSPGFPKTLILLFIWTSNIEGERKRQFKVRDNPRSYKITALWTKQMASSMAELGVWTFRWNHLEFLWSNVTTSPTRTREMRAPPVNDVANELDQ